MGVVGFQDFWAAGARVYIEKQTAGVSQDAAPLIDLGVVQQANPVIAPEIVQQMDSDGGTRAIVDEAITQIDESYDVTLNNFNPDTLSLLFMGDDAEEVTRPIEAKAAFHTLTNGRFVKIKDDGDGTDADWGLLSIDGIYDSTGTISSEFIDSMTASTDLITLTAAEGDLTALFIAGFKFIVTGHLMSDPLNAGTYKVASSAFTGGKTEITINTTYKDMSSDETFGGGDGLMIINATNTTWDLGIDWTIHSKERGIIGVLATGGISDGSYGVAWTVNTLTGKRLISPQSALGVIKAKVYITYSRDNFARQTVREFEASITPSAASVQVSDYSTMNLTFRVLSDLTNVKPAGRLLSYRGAVPAASDPSSGLD